MNYTLELTINNQIYTTTPRSCAINNVVANENLQHTESSAQLTLNYDPELLNALALQTGIKAQIKDGLKVLFTGIINENFSWTDVGRPYPVESIDLAIQDNTSLFDKKTTEEIGYLNASLFDIVNRFCVDCDVIIAPEQTLPTSLNIQAFVIDTGASYKDTLNNLLFQYGYSYFFNTLGQFCFYDFKVISSSPENLDSSTMLQKAKVQRMNKNYTAVKVTYNTLSKKTNELVYFEGGGYDSNNYPKPIFVQPGVYYPFESTPIVEADEGQIYQTFSSGYAQTKTKYNGEKDYQRSKGTALLYTENHSLVEDWKGGNIQKNRLEFGFRRSSVRLYNAGNKDAEVMSISIRADAWYRDVEATVITGQGEKEYTCQSEFVFSATHAENLSKALCRFFTGSVFKITVQTEIEIMPGTYNQIDTGFSGFITNALLIASSYDSDSRLYTNTYITVGKTTIDTQRFKNSIGSGAEQGITDTIITKINDLELGTTPEDISPYPDSLTVETAIAKQDSIIIKARPLSAGLKNTVKTIRYEIKKTISGAWEQYEQNAFTFEYAFDRAVDGYPESGTSNPKDLGNWRVRAKAINTYGKASEDYGNGTVGIVVNADNYGTWIQEKPTVFNVQSANRAVNMSWQRPANALGKEIYGLKYYEIQISKNGTNWYKPAVNKTGKDSESDWYDGTGQLRNDSANYTQSLPLTGQTLSLPENTTYYFRVRTVGETNTSDWSDTQTGIALATGIGDVVAKAIKAEQLADSAVTNVHIQDNSIVASDKIVSNSITTNKLNVLAKNKINNFSVTGTLEGWTTSGTLEDDASGFKKLRFTNDWVSSNFTVQPNEICSFEFGISCPNYTSLSGAFIGLTAGQSFKQYTWSFTRNKWVAGTVSSNAYFIRDYKATSVKYFKTYILGSNVSINDIPAPSATDTTHWIDALQLQGTDTTASLRTGFNATTQGTYWELYNPQIYNVNMGKITASQVVTANLSSISADIGTITSGNLQSVIKTGENIPNVFLNLDTEEFRVGTNPSKDNTDEGEYLHYKPGVGFFLKIKNFIVTSLSSMIRGIFKVYAIGKQDSESAFVVNPSNDADPSTGVGSNTTYIGTDLLLDGRVVSDLNIDGKVRVSNAIEKPFKQIIRESAGVIAQSFTGTGKNDLAIIEDTLQKGHIEVKILSPAINDQTAFGGKIFNVSGTVKEVHSDRLQEQDWNIAKAWAEETRSGKTWRLPTRAELSQINPSGAFWTSETSGDSAYIYNGKTGLSFLRNKQVQTQIGISLTSDRYTAFYMERDTTDCIVVGGFINKREEIFKADNYSYSSNTGGSLKYTTSTVISLNVNGEVKQLGVTFAHSTTSRVIKYDHAGGITLVGFSPVMGRRTCQSYGNKAFVFDDTYRDMEIYSFSSNGLVNYDRRANFFPTNEDRIISVKYMQFAFIFPTQSRNLEIVNMEQISVVKTTNFFNSVKYRFCAFVSDSTAVVPHYGESGLDIVNLQYKTVIEKLNVFPSKIDVLSGFVFNGNVYMVCNGTRNLAVYEIQTGTGKILLNFFDVAITSRVAVLNEKRNEVVIITNSNFIVTISLDNLIAQALPVRNNTETQRKQISSSTNGTSWTIRSTSLITAGQMFTSYFGLKLRFAGDGHKVGDYWRFEQDEMGAFSLQDSDGVEYVKATNGKLWVKEFVNTTAVPIGFIYIQLPGEATPADIFGGVWTNVSSSFAGLFFRVEGGSAAAFNGTAQSDAMQNIFGIFKSVITDSYTGFSATGPFYNGGKPRVRGWSTYDSDEVRTIGFDASRQVRTATETRPVNKTIRIWRRTA